MCIIAAKKKGVAMPSDKYIENMWANNSDGAGFMYAKDGRVCIEKGFMKLADLQAALRRVSKSVDLKNTTVVMHFRITTHGGTKPANCHPFPIADNYGKLGKLVQTAKLGVAHNGIIHSVNAPKGMSDTMAYIVEQLAPLARFAPEFYRSKDAMLMVQNAIQSKLCIMNGKGELFTIGKFAAEDGILYSNDSYSYKWFRRGSSLYDWGTPFDGGAYSGSTKVTTPVTTTDIYAAEEEGISLNTGELIYEERELMLLNDGAYNDQCECVANRANELVPDDCDYFIDAGGQVYRYSYALDACVRCDGYKAYDENLMSLRFDDARAFTESVAINVTLDA